LEEHFDDYQQSKETEIENKKYKTKVFLIPILKTLNIFNSCLWLSHI